MLKALFQKIKHNHMLLMVLCCALPILGFLILPYLGFNESTGYYLLFLLCPIAHIFMMKGMHSCDHKDHSPQGPKLIEYKPASSKNVNR